MLSTVALDLVAWSSLRVLTFLGIGSFGVTGVIHADELPYWTGAGGPVEVGSYLFLKLRAQKCHSILQGGLGKIHLFVGKTQEQGKISRVTNRT